MGRETLNWLRGDDGNTLCVDGYPIRIKRVGGDMPFLLEADNHQAPRRYHTLAGAKLDARIYAEEMDEFLPPASGEASDA